MHAKGGDSNDAAVLGGDARPPHGGLPCGTATLDDEDINGHNVLFVAAQLAGPMLAFCTAHGMGAIPWMRWG